MASNRTADLNLAQEVKETVKRIPLAAKAQAVLRIAANLKQQSPNWRMVVFTTRKETQRMLGEVLCGAGIPNGFIAGGEPSKNQMTIEAFRTDNPTINVIVSTDAGAEGINLQSSNILVNYDLPWNPMIVEQRIGRVQRIGSKFRNVHVANVVHRNSPEHKIVVRLMEKLQVISQTVGDIESVLEATDDPNGDSLEKQIRQMVVASLKGQDQEAAARMAEQSIEQATQLIEQNQAEMDRTLGSRKESDDSDVPMPRLTPALPSMSLREFVINALRVEGATVLDSYEGQFSVRSAGLGEERFTFDEKVLQRFTQPGVFMGRAPLLYQQGKPAFERLVQRWIDRSAIMIRDSRKSESEVEQCAKEWISTIDGASMVKAQVSERREVFEGSIVCRTRVSNAVDSYEKLIRVGYHSNAEAPTRNTDLTKDMRPMALFPTMDKRIGLNVESDSDINKFKEYYESRLRKELLRSDSGERKKKLINDLSPSIIADVSAVEGVLADTVKIAVRYFLGGEIQYQSSITISGTSILNQPERNVCAVTGRVVPVDCLQRCSVTGKSVLRELLQKSEESGEYAIPDSFATCEETGKKVHGGEIDVCCITGKRVCKSQLQTSEMSGRLAVRSSAAKCEITQAIVLIDEIVSSDFLTRSGFGRF